MQIPTVTLRVAVTLWALRGAGRPVGASGRPQEPHQPTGSHSVAVSKSS